MQCRLLEEYTNAYGKQLARIFIQGITEGKGFSNRIFPGHIIDKGAPLEANVHDWEVRVKLMATKMDDQAWETPDLPNSTTLGQTIVRLVASFRDSLAKFMEKDISRLVNDIGITNLTDVIVDGIKRADLYTVLTQPSEEFTKDELINAARYTFDHTSTTRVCGIHTRLHKIGSFAPHWKRDTTYLYVGKSDNKRSTYDDLTRNSEYTMIAVCVLPPNSKSGLYFLAEKVIFCLLQTYRQSSYADITSQIQNVSLHMASSYFIAVAEKTFGLTVWRGDVRRPSFGVQEGVNSSSPTLEYGRWSEKQVFIRTDSFVNGI